MCQVMEVVVVAPAVRVRLAAVDELFVDDLVLVEEAVVSAWLLLYPQPLVASNPTPTPALGGVLGTSPRVYSASMEKN